MTPVPEPLRREIPEPTPPEPEGADPAILPGSVPERLLHRRSELQLLLLAVAAWCIGDLVESVILKTPTAACGPLPMMTRLQIGAGTRCLVLFCFLKGVRYARDPEGRTLHARLGLHRWRSRWLWIAPLAALGLLAMAGGLTELWRWTGLKLGLAFDLPPNERLIAGLSFSERLFFAGSTVVLAPVVEELFFRRILYGVARLWIPVLPAMILIAALFAAAHGTLLQAPGLFLMGLVWQQIFRRTQSLYPPLLMHAWSNAWASALLLLPA